MLFLSPLFTISKVNADTYNIIDEENYTENLSKGVVHQNISYFTTEGWININVLKIDLTDRYTSISTIFNPDGIKDRMNVEDMANANGAIAAVNGDFFDTNTGFVVGAAVKDGKLISDPSDLSGKLATFSIDLSNNPSIDYWSKNMSVTLPSGVTIPLAAVNKISTTFEYLTMYTRDWSNMSPGASQSVPKLVEVVVDKNDKVLDVRQGQPSVEIPDGGYVLDGSGYVGDNLLTLKPGDTIQKNLTTLPAFDSLKMAVSGGTVLVRNGAIATFTQNIKGYFARTAIGYTQDKKHIIIATVDNASTRGMTQEEMANLMLSLGAYDAMNLDGGSSTQMVVRHVGDKQAVLSNFTSSQARKVADGVGVFNTAPIGNLYALKLETQDTNVFKGLHMTITVKGYDENYQPVDINPSTVSFSINGISGTFNGNVFMPTSTGEGVITARVGNVTGTLKITSLDKPVDIRFNPYNIIVDKDKTMPITVTAKNINGYRALIEPQDITWDIYNNVGSMDSTGNFHASSADVSGALVANVSGQKGVLYVKVGQGSSFDSSVLPQITNFSDIDPANKDVPVSNTSSSFKFMVFGDTKYDTLLRLQISLKAADTANKDYPLAIFTGDVNERVLKALKIKYIVTGNNYNVYNYNNSTFIVLNNRGGGLLAADKNQWTWFKNQLKNAQGDNLFIILPQPVWGTEGFKDSREATLFEDTLKEFKKNTGKNVWIIYNSQNKFYTTLNDEIRYISNYGTDIGGGSPDIFNDFGYISVMINGKNINYQFKNLMK